jgi:ATP-dependent Clp protease ATP-binding subunit ClpA
MEIKPVYIKDLYSKINIIVLNKRESVNELKKVSVKITEEDYKLWVLNTCVIGINNISSYLKDGTASLISQLQEANEDIYKRVIALNEFLDPKNLFISNKRELTHNNTKHLLTKTKNWSKEGTYKEITTVDFQNFLDICSASSLMEYTQVPETFKDLNLIVNIRSFSENDLTALVNLMDLETDSHLKYSVLAECIDNFSEIITLIIDEVNKSRLDMVKTVSSLYSLCIKHNSFLYLNLNEAKYLKKEQITSSFSQTSSAFNSLFEKLEADEEEEELKTKPLKSVPLAQVTELEDKLKSSIYGQDDAIKAIYNSVKRAHMGLKPQNRPIAAFLFYGPTSTGKTELAKVLAECLRGSASEGLVKIPCGTVLNESHTIQTLIGAPPSYVGHESKSLFGAHFSKDPNLKIILFDEIDKAHPKVFDFLLEAMDEGNMMDSKGNCLNLRDSILIFTCNTGQKEAIKASKAAGFTLNTSNESHQHTVEEIYKTTIDNKLVAEFRARLNGQFFFRRLSESELILTGKKYLNDFFKVWEKENKSIVNVSEEVYNFMLKKCISSQKDCHARHLNHFIDDQIIDKLGDLLIDKNITPSSIKSIDITIENDLIDFHIIEKKKKLKK